LGLITVPARAMGYVADEDGAFAFDIRGSVAGPLRPISVNRTAPMHVVASRSHGHKALALLSAEMGVAEDLSVGSSLKFCQVAAGEARLYPRFTPTCEWDTAAGQAILERAGGAVVTLDGEPLRYGKSGGNGRFLNPFFAAADDLDLARETAKIMRRVMHQ